MPGTWSCRSIVFSDSLVLSTVLSTKSHQSTIHSFNYWLLISWHDCYKQVLSKPVCKCMCVSLCEIMNWSTRVKDSVYQPSTQLLSCPICANIYLHALCVHVWEKAPLIINDSFWDLATSVAVADSPCMLRSVPLPKLLCGPPCVSDARGVTSCRAEPDIEKFYHEVCV